MALAQLHKWNNYSSYSEAHLFLSQTAVISTTYTIHLIMNNIPPYFIFSIVCLLYAFLKFIFILKN